MRILGNGTIQQRKDKNGKRIPDSWRIRFNLGYDSIKERYRYSPWRTVHGTKNEARRALLEYRSEIEKGLRIDDEKVRFSEYASIYLDRRESLESLLPPTLMKLRQSTRQLIECLGDIPLRSLDTETIEAMIVKQRRKGASDDHIRRLVMILKRILNDACDRDFIVKNPANKIKLPKLSKPKTSFLKPDDLNRLLRVLDEPQELFAGNGAGLSWMHKFAQKSHIMAVRIALATGARRGEVLGLCWKVIDLNNCTVQIKQQNTPTGIREPKTKAGNREVSIDLETAERLREWHIKQAEYLLKHGIRQSDDIPVITDELGGWQDPNNFSRWWRTFCKLHEFGDLRFHDIRHTHASLLIASGMDIKTVQSRLGHEKPSTTLDMYAHVMPGRDKEAAAMIGQLLKMKEPLAEVVNL